MGVREAFFLGSVLLLSCGNLHVTSQNRLNISTDETLSQVPQEEATGSSQLPRSTQAADHPSNRPEQRHPVRYPVSYRLRSYELRSPAVSKQKPDPRRSEAGESTSGQLEPRSTALAQKLLKFLVQGPDLNPPVKQESKVLVKFEQRVAVPADSVAVRCGESEVTVEVKQNFLGNSQLIHLSDLTLGGCAALGPDDHVLMFQTALQGCGSTMTMTEDTLIYSFSLMYSPTPIGDTYILKTNPAEVVIECHYQRRHYVSSNALRPAWQQLASDMQEEQQLHFSLRLMTEDWQSQRPSSVYFPSDVMHIEAAVLQGHHVPLRVYVDSCVATANPDPSSHPRYTFINNHGCLTDAKLTGAKSYFMQRSQEDKLHFLLKPFRLHRDHRNSLYITCQLKATTLSVPIDSQHKVCSFLTEANRWVASGGDNKVCSCCESSCGERRWKRSLAAETGLPPDQQWEGTAALGPILLEELTEVFEVPPGSVSPPQTHEVIPAASHPSIALLCGVGAALAVVLLAVTRAISCSRLHKPTVHSVCS